MEGVTMADEEHVALLEQGVGVWDTWRGAAIGLMALGLMKS